MIRRGHRVAIRAGSRRAVTRLTLLPAVSLLAGAVFGPADAATLLDRGRLAFDYRSWTVDTDTLETTVSQMRIPVVATLGLGPAQLVVSSAGASSSVEPDGGSSASLDGLTDVTAQLFLRLAGDRLLVHAGASLPTGVTGLDEEQFFVAQALAHPVLGFGLKEYGRGLDLSAGAAAAFPIAPGVAAGFGAGFVTHGEYTLLENGDDYTPGDEISATAGLDLGTNAHGTAEGGNEDGAAALRLDAVYRTFAADELGGREIFEEGDQITVEAVARAVSGRIGADALARVVLQQDNTVFAGDGEAVEELTSPAGTQVLLIGGLDARAAGSLRLGVEAEWNRFTGSAGGGRDGDAYGIGPVASLRLGDRGVATIRTRVLSGSLDAGDGADEIDLSGFQIGLGVQIAGY